MTGMAFGESPPIIEDMLSRSSEILIGLILLFTKSFLPVLLGGRECVFEFLLSSLVRFPNCGKDYFASFKSCLYSLRRRSRSEATKF